jgi:hypothetical protein
VCITARVLSCRASPFVTQDRAASDAEKAVRDATPQMIDLAHPIHLSVTGSVAESARRRHRGAAPFGRRREPMRFTVGQPAMQTPSVGVTPQGR